MIHSFDVKSEKLLEEWLLEHVGLEVFKGNFERLDQFFQVFKDDLARRPKKIITVGGTNGKGQTCFLLEMILNGEGINTVTWSSPHILSVTERFRLNGRQIDPKELLSLFQKAEEKLGCSNLSYYEFLFYVFMTLAISKSEIDVIILEVGLGGRLDAVNYFEPDLTAIVSIGRDHENILGKGLSNILIEKMGITRKQTPLITTIEQPFLRDKVLLESKKKDFPWIDLYEFGWCVAERDSFEMTNYYLAWSLANYYLKQSFPLKEMRPGTVSRVKFKGRREKMTLGNLRFIFIGAHNVDGMRKLTQSLVLSGETQTQSPDRPIFWLSFSNREKDEIHLMLDILEASCCLYSEVWVSPFDHPKAIKEDVLEAVINERVQSPVRRPKKGYIRLVGDWKEKLRGLQKPENFLLTGSYYFMGAFQRELYNLGSERGLSIHT